MSITVHADPVPLHVDETGTLRVGNTRITLDVLLADHRNGMTPEEIVEQLDTLTLPDVYGALAYYYRHQEELDEYLKRRREEADQAQQRIEAAGPTAAQVKARLLAKRSSAHASPAE
jgi:uncharacterized protein (DUF433 family)